MGKSSSEPYYCPLVACDHNEKGTCNINGACDYDGQDEPEEEEL
jgi:hypothetical protein